MRNPGGTSPDLPADRVLEVARLLTTVLRASAGGAKVVVLDLEGLPDVDTSDPERPVADRQDGQGARQTTSGGCERNDPVEAHT